MVLTLNCHESEVVDKPALVEDGAPAVSEDLSTTAMVEDCRDENVNEKNGKKHKKSCLQEGVC